VIDFCNVAELCIVGGSFVDGIGGHNVLEPASLKKPIIYGPFHANFKDIALDMIEKNAIVISSKDSINQDAFAILSNSSKITQLSENAYSSFIENRGVSGKGVINEVLKFLI
jgi:3-deoxy-D-manno-octulosonic-acid transferase